MTDLLPNKRETAKKLWFLPSACVLAALWLAYPEGVSSAAPGADCAGGSAGTGHAAGASTGTAGATPRPPVSAEVGSIGMAQHVLLLLLTCGIWLYIWIYRTTGYLNRVEDEPLQTPSNQLLLCMFVPFYFICWAYKNAQRPDKLAAQNGMSSDSATLCLILAIFVPIIPPILIRTRSTPSFPAAPPMPRPRPGVLRRLPAVPLSVQRG